jgi:hypothetical protein
MAITKVFCNSGKTIVAELLRDATSAKPLYVAIGNGTTTPDETDTVMESELYRVLGTAASVSASSGKVTGTITITGSDTITEYGVFDAASGGNMFYHGVESSGDAVVADNTFVFELTVTVAQGSF